eukprot:5741626-Pyramimonas_sp.AAC.1
MVAPEPLALTPINVKRMGRKTKVAAKAKTWSAALTQKRESARAEKIVGSPRPLQVIQLRDNGSTLAAQ